MFDAAVATAEFRNAPYRAYTALRATDPVHWCAPWGCWVLTRYDDIAAVLQDFARFSNRGRVTNVIQREFPDTFLEQIKPLLHHFSKGLINVDPPDHTRLRRLVQKTFLPKTLERLRPRVHTLVGELLDHAAPRGRMDLVAELTFPLPVIVIAELLGVPPDMRERFKNWSTTILEFQAVPRPDQTVILQSQAAIVEMRAYLKEVVAERRRAPREDLLSELAAAEEQGDRLTEDELLSTGVSLLVAGHETTTNLIASAVLLLLQHPEQLAALRADVALLPGAIEETLRYESPLQRLGRTALVDVEIRGRKIKKGQTVLSLLGAANRDPAQFPDADRFDIRRNPNRHLAFGNGIHFCLGAPLARLEAPIAIAELLRRFPKLSLERAPHEHEWHSGVMRGLESLPVTW
ncbi:MAG: cytochrome P450 [Verrucomicrobiota bacterium]